MKLFPSSGDNVGGYKDFKKFLKVEIQFLGEENEL